MPAPCDQGVVAFRKWWDLAGGAAGLPWAPGASAPAVAAAPADGPTREQLLSRHLHNQNCAACRTAVERLGVAQRAGYASAAALVLAAAAVGSWPLAAGGGAAVALGAAAGWARQRLLFKDYVHARKG